MADKAVVDIMWLDALREFRRTHKGRNPNLHEIETLKQSLKSN